MNYAWEEGRSGDGHVGTDWCLYQLREIFVLNVILYSAAVWVTEHFQHSVKAGKSKDPLVENCFFWASFNVRNLCCPWAINNSWSVLEAPQYACVYTFTFMSLYVCLDVCLSCFAHEKWRSTFLIYSVEALDNYYIHIPEITLNRLCASTLHVP